ncbi:MAG TPA: c-type cytochrome domain-containing protein, partial [Bryobacteraceae bacterium]|nr:c-type cytochrome domain-containing protein [Bryobacteraceae bacterium]
MSAFRWSVLTAGFLVTLSAQNPTSRTVDPRSLLDRYCVGCHNDRVKAGQVSLHPGSTKEPAQNPELWERVVTKLRHRHMPP